MPLDVGELRPDIVVAVGYKWLLGPFSFGYLYLDPNLHDGEPLEENWILRAGSDDFSRVDYRDEYLPGARRFDVGQRTSFHLVPMAMAAIQQLLDWTVPSVAETLRTRTDEIASRAGALGFRTPPANARAPHMIGVEVPGDADAVAAALAGAKVIASVRGSSIRIAPHLHNSREDLDRLLSVLAAAN
jgi:selenocysteine lyase/cysteine desulfurase